jgi:hypothetical protein
MKDKLRNLLKKFQEEWQKAFITAAVALSFTLLAIFGKSLLHWVKRADATVHNVSQQQAQSIARVYVGESLVSAIPFRNVGDDTQYIAAVTNATPAFAAIGEGLEAFVLVGRGQKYETHSIDTPVYDQNSTNDKDLQNIFGVLDLDGDGKHLVFAIYRTGGTGSYSVNIQLYDPSSDSKYTLTEDGEYDDSNLEPTFSDNVSARPTVKRWLTQKGKDFIIAKTDKPGYLRETNLWRESQAADFTTGLVHIHEFPGKIPIDNTGTIVCEVEDNDFQWMSFFKGGVFAYDKKHNKHFAVWVPSNQYDWVSELTSGETYLWFGEDKASSVLAFDKKEHFLNSPATIYPSGTEFSHRFGCKPTKDN